MSDLHPIYRVTDFRVVAPFTLLVSFSDGVSREIDFLPVLEGELYGPLREVSLFNQVALDHDAETLVWPNGADFDPATLHDWPTVSGEMKALAARWRVRSS